MESGKVMTPSPTEAPAEKFADVSREAPYARFNAA